MELLKEHRNDVSVIQEELRKWLKERSPSHTNGGVTLGQQHHSSNTLRGNSYKNRGPRLAIHTLNRVLEIDTAARTALVEPRITMQQLVDAALPYGLVPAVLPEFKSITVGGAINGAGIESSSHEYGQFNDICSEYEVLLGNGEVITASAENHADLFYGISGSYGSLGIVLSAKVQLIEASEWVVLRYHDFISIEEAVHFMKEQCSKEAPSEYIEAIAFNKECVVVITASLCRDEKHLRRVPKLSFGKPWDKWYYQVIKERFGSAIREEAVSLRDYLFRQDRGAFWMGAYALHPALLFCYLQELCGIHSNLFKTEDFTAFNQMKMPSWWFRWMFGWMMKSERLYGFMHNGTEKWFAEHFAIQDYYLPIDAAASFTEQAIDKYAILPIWFCPVKASKTEQIFSPHAIDDGGSALLLDVGIYGLAKNNISGETAVRDLDRLSRFMGGKKMFYSYSYYTQEEFWEIYPKEAYDALRRKYFAENVLLDITKKVL